MQSLPTGGKTPLAKGLAKGFELMKRELMVNQDAIPRMILVSDGKANVGIGSSTPFEEAKELASHIREAGIPSLVIDSEQNFISFGLAREIADELGGKYLKLEELAAENLADVVKGLGM